MTEERPLRIQAGLVIGGRYRVEGPMESGAMGAVWRATHVALGAPVAIKFLNRAIAGSPEMLARFLREAKAAALVRSTHVVQVFDYGAEQGSPYIVMELLVGESLEQRLEQRGVLAPGELGRIFGEVARALAVAHEMGVVHRDLKPGNIFLAREGDRELTKVLDFGIAKCLEHKLATPADIGTETGVTLGTPHYMSAEQARGDRNLDHRTDIWSLAVVAFECATGQRPFQGAALGELLVNICVGEPRLPSALAPVPAGFDDWFLKAVSKDPEARYQSVSELAGALARVLREEPGASGERQSVAPAVEHAQLGKSVRGSATEPLARARLTPRRVRALLAALGTGVAGALLGWLLGGADPAPAQPEAAALQVSTSAAPSLPEPPVLAQPAPAPPQQELTTVLAGSDPSAEQPALSAPSATPPARPKRRAKSAERKSSKSPPTSEAAGRAGPVPEAADPFAERL